MSDSGVREAVNSREASSTVSGVSSAGASPGNTSGSYLQSARAVR